MGTMGFIIAELFYNTQVCYIILGICEDGIIRYRKKQIIKISVRGIFFARVRVCLGSMRTRSRCTLSAGFFCGCSRRSSPSFAGSCCCLCWSPGCDA